MFLQNWYPRETSLLVTGWQIVKAIFTLILIKTLHNYCLTRLFTRRVLFSPKGFSPRENNIPRVNNYDVHRKCRQYLIYVMFHVCPEMYPFLHSGITTWPEVKNTNMKFMKTQDKNKIKIQNRSVYCIQHYCK
jgi:hypothetical protein